MRISNFTAPRAWDDGLKGEFFATFVVCEFIRRMSLPREVAALIRKVEGEVEHAFLFGLGNGAAR